MWMEAGQAAVEAAKQGSYIQVAIPTALVSSTLALIGREGIAFLVNRRRGKNGIKPGMGDECLKHRDKLGELETKQEYTDKAIDEMRGDVKELLRRVPPK